MGGYSLGGSYAEVSIDVDDVTEGLNEFNVRTKRAIWKYFQQEACPMLKQYMVDNHPWQNRTRTAEIGLDAKVNKSGNMKRTDYMLELEISHSAYHKGFPYGNSLETGSFNARTGRRNKPYPIIEPTKRIMFPKVIEDLEGIIDYYG